MCHYNPTPISRRQPAVSDRYESVDYVKNDDTLYVLRHAQLPYCFHPLRFKAACSCACCSESVFGGLPLSDGAVEALKSISVQVRQDLSMSHPTCLTS